MVDGLGGGGDLRRRLRMLDDNCRSLLYLWVVLKDNMLFMYSYYVVFGGLSHG